MAESTRPSYIGAIIRITILVLLLALIAFFIIRWARGRSDNKPSDNQTSQQQTNKQSSSDSSSKSTSETPLPDSSSSNSSENKTKEPTPAPTPTPTPQVPSTGMGESILLTTLLLGICTYLAVRLKYSHSL